jgi:hypothetical protein
VQEELFNSVVKGATNKISVCFSKFVCIYCTARQLLISLKFEVFMLVKIQVKVFWDVMTCSVVVGYQHFREP